MAVPRSAECGGSCLLSQQAEGEGYWELRLKDEFVASLGYRMKTCLKTKLKYT